MDTRIQPQIGYYGLELDPIPTLAERVAIQQAALLHPLIARKGSDVQVALHTPQKTDGKPEVYGEAGEEYINRLIDRGGNFS